MSIHVSATMHDSFTLTEATSVTSIVTACTCLPSTKDFKASEPSGFLAHAITVSPLFLSCLTNSAPIPREVPVTTQVKPIVKVKERYVLNNFARPWFIIFHHLTTLIPNAGPQEMQMRSFLGNHGPISPQTTWHPCHSTYATHMFLKNIHLALSTLPPYYAATCHSLLHWKAPLVAQTQRCDAYI